MTAIDMPAAGHDTAHPDSAQSEKDERTLAARILFTLLIVLAAWGVAIYQFGVPGLYLPALATVPFIYGLLITIARG